MPAIILALLPILAKYAPSLVGLAFGGSASAVAAKVETAVRDVFGTTDAAEVQAQVTADPAKADALKTRLDAETDQLRTELADVADARATALALAQAHSPLAWGSPVISVIVVSAFAAVAAVVVVEYGVESPVGQLIAGALIAKFGTVVDYWLGSSKGSADRVDQIVSMLHESIGEGAAALRRKGRA